MIYFYFTWIVNTCIFNFSSSLYYQKVCKKYVIISISNCILKYSLYFENILILLYTSRFKEKNLLNMNKILRKFNYVMLPRPWIIFLLPVTHVMIRKKFSIRFSGIQILRIKYMRKTNTDDWLLINTIVY